MLEVLSVALEKNDKDKIWRFLKHYYGNYTLKALKTTQALKTLKNCMLHWFGLFELKTKQQWRRTEIYRTVSLILTPRKFIIAKLKTHEYVDDSKHSVNG